MDPGLKILSSAENKHCDILTIRMEGMNAHDLMDRATLRIFHYIQDIFPTDKPITFFCGPGNNGADGLCIASLFAAKGYPVETKVCLLGKAPSSALQFRLKLYSARQKLNIQVIQDLKDLTILDDTPFVDALFGTGLTQPLQGEWEKLVYFINQQKRMVVSIDMPSGLPDEPGKTKIPFVNAQKVIAIQCPKPSLLYAENELDFETVDCGINTESIDTKRYFLDAHHLNVQQQMKQLLPLRPRHSHKGSYGHTLLIGGNNGMHGAISMAAKACYEAGSGLTTVLSPETAIPYLSAHPEIMHITQALDAVAIEKLPKNKFRSVAIGPGLGVTSDATALLTAALKHFPFPLILDADALNIMAQHPALMKTLPAGTLITPHPGEFARLFGSTENGRQKEILALEHSHTLGIYILAKNTYSFLACPDGKIFYNGTGNSSMARGGSGDKLTGMIAGLYAQHQNMRDAALAGMYFSGIGKPII